MEATTVDDTNEGRARALVAAVNAAAHPRATPVGILTPLTGPGDPVAGELIVRGACLGARYLRESGLPEVRFALENDQATAAAEGMQRSAVAGVAKLAMVDEVVALLGQWHLRTAPHVAATAELLGVPIFVENGHNTITAQRRRTVFRTYFSIADRMPMIISFLADHKMHRIGLVAPNTVFGAMLGDTVQAVATGWDAPFEVLRFDFDQESTTDVRDELRRIKEYEPDVFVNCGVVRTNYMVINQAAEVGLLPGVPLLVTFPFPMRSQDYWRLAGPSGNLVMWPATYYRPSWPGLTDLGRWFTDQYLAEHGSFPPDNALNAFTDVTIIGQALAKAAQPTRPALLDTLEEHEFGTWRGPVRFTRGAEHWHHSPPEHVLMQYQRVGQDFDDAAVIYPPAARTAEYLSPR
jgi:branched-chain amino acid transport system substrate-binding protein